MTKIFDNKTEKVGDDLMQSITTGSRIDVASAIFSIYGYSALKKQLDKISQLRFVFTDPTFLKSDKDKREHRQFQINSNLRKKAISGSSFEINLKNELKGKATAKECKKWIEQKVTFKTNIKNRYIQPHLSLKNKDKDIIYTGITEFSSAGFGFQKDNAILHNIMKMDDSNITQQFSQTFQDIWQEEVELNKVIQNKKHLLNTIKGKLE